MHSHIRNQKYANSNTDRPLIAFIHYNKTQATTIPRTQSVESIKLIGRNPSPPPSTTLQRSSSASEMLALVNLANLQVRVLFYPAIPVLRRNYFAYPALYPPFAMCLRPPVDSYPTAPSHSRI